MHAYYDFSVYKKDIPRATLHGGSGLDLRAMCAFDVHIFNFLKPAPGAPMYPDESIIHLEITTGQLHPIQAPSSSLT